MRLTCMIILAGLVLWFAPATALAQTYEVTWHTIDCGGGTSTGGGFELEGTIGQADASGSMAAFGYSVMGGYWLGPLTGPCGTADFNGDGDFGTDQDVEAFFACLAGSCCETCCECGQDFNADGDFGTDQDIESFFRVITGGPC